MRDTFKLILAVILGSSVALYEKIKQNSGKSKSTLKDFCKLLLIIVIGSIVIEFLSFVVFGGYT